MKKGLLIFCASILLTTFYPIAGHAETTVGEDLTESTTSPLTTTTTETVSTTSTTEESTVSSEPIEQETETDQSTIPEATSAPEMKLNEQTSSSTQETSTSSEEKPKLEISAQKTDRQYVKINRAAVLYTLQGSELIPTKTLAASSQLFKTTKKAQAADGEFLAISDQKNQALGWVKKAEVTVLKGSYETVNRYVTITKKGYSFWQDPSFAKENLKSAPYYQKTLRVAEVFHHTNGSDYLAIYRNNGQFVGYINASGTAAAPGQQGIFLSDNQYATITSKNYTIWNNFNWQKKGTSAAYAGKTVKIKGRYEHYNGSRYYSLYDSKGKWLGYMNATGLKATKNPQGTYQNYGKYVTITKNNYTIWGNFNWKVKKNSTTKVAGQTFLAKGKYGHYNGSTYYSLYNNKGKWVGYLNAKAASVAKNAGGIWQKETKKVRVVKKNYTLWQNFSWQKRGNTTSYHNQILQVKGKYRHFNGSTYYSLYTTNGKWLGYGNSGAFGTPNVVYSQKTINRFVKLTNGSGNFLTNPDPYSRALGKKSTYKGYMARAIKEAKTNNGTFLYLVMPGGNLGWVKSNQTTSVQSNYWMHTSGGRYPSLKVKNLNIQVSVSKQRVYIRSGSKTIYTMICSTGLWNYPTPYGNFRIQGEKGLSFWYGGSGGAYYRSYHQHGVYLFHTVPIAYPGTTNAFNAREGAKLGMRASHGCIRLSVPDAKWFYYNIPYNTPVKIYH